MSSTPSCDPQKLVIPYVVLGVECLLPVQNLALFSILASDLKHLRLYSNAADSGVRLNSLWCLSCSCCLGHLTTGELNREVQAALGWKGVSVG